MKVIKKIKVSYQGIPGAYSHQAIKKYFKNKALACAKPTFTALFFSVLEGKCLYGMMPVFNSTTGEIKPTCKLLKRSQVKVVGEISLKICHNLLSLPDANLREIKKVYSHPQALLQCQKFFKTYPYLKATEYVDTAASAKYISQLKRKGLAAIASSEAGKIYKLKVLKRNVQTRKNNYTHFYIITRKGGEKDE